MIREAPDVQDTAWGHKYFHLMCPTKLDDYHISNLQRFHLIKLLQIPPKAEGRYVCAGQFVALAKESGISLNFLTTLLNKINGRQYYYWRIGTRSGRNDQSFWDEMRQENVVSLGWGELGDLSWVNYNQESKDKLRAQLQNLSMLNRQLLGVLLRKCSVLLPRSLKETLYLQLMAQKFLASVVSLAGMNTSRAIGFPHRRPVVWLHLISGNCRNAKEGLQGAVHLLRIPENQIAIETKLLKQKDQKPGGEQKRPNGIGTIGTVVRSEGIPGRIQSVLERKRQIILYGPPGTGKTYWAMRTANDLAAYQIFGRSYQEFRLRIRVYIRSNRASKGIRSPMYLSPNLWL